MRVPSTVSSESGTARALASTAAVTFSGTPILQAPRRKGGVIASDGRRPYLRIVHDGASERICHARRHDPRAQSRRCSGTARLRNSGNCPVALLGLLGRHEMRQGHDRIDRCRRWFSRSCENCRTYRFRNAGRRPQYSGPSTRRLVPRPGSTTTSALQPLRLPGPTRSTRSS